MISDAERFGMDAESIDNLRGVVAGRTGRDEGVWPEHVPIVEAFLIVSSQWRTATLGGGMGPGRVLYIGFDYGAVLAGLSAAAVTVTPELWRGVRVMEDAARAALNGGER